MSRRPLDPIPFDQWPTWAKDLAQSRAPGEIGVGSTVKTQLGLLGDAFTRALKSLGIPCGCKRRRERWDQLYPYPTEPPPAPDGAPAPPV